MKLTFRLDDITPDMDRENFGRVTALLEKAGAFPLLGVVPENQDGKLSRGEPDPDFPEMLKRKKALGYTLALHGLHHVYDTKKGGLFPLNLFSEFAGHPYEEQKSRLQTGKALLRMYGVETDVFMAPAHSYDRETLRALKDTGFRFVTDGFGAEPYEREGLVFFPISFRKRDSLDPAREGMTTIVLHTNEMTDGEIADMERLLDSHAEQLLPYSAWFARKPRKRGACGDLQETVKARLKRRLVKRGLH